MAKTANEGMGTVLIIDDNATNLGVIVNHLETEGFEIMTARDGRDGVEKAQRGHPDLILLDVMMPETDGFETCLLLKNKPSTRHIPVIFMTALTEVDDKVKGFEVGGVDYVTKPIQAKEVLARVKTHIALQQLQKRVEDKNEALSQALQTLQATQQELIQAEKMAALGQLVAGIAHELNTPLGAIRSSVGNVTEFFEQDLRELPAFFRALSTEDQQHFNQLLNRSGGLDARTSTQEKRAARRSLRRQLSEAGLSDVDTWADTLVEIGVVEDMEAYLPLLQEPTGQVILNMVYQFLNVQRSTQTITTAAERAAKVVFALRTYAHQHDPGKQVEVDIAAGIETILTLYEHQLKNSIQLVRQYDEVPPVWCYPDELNQVWTNLIHNAIQAMEKQGQLTITIQRAERTPDTANLPQQTTSAEAPYLQVSITDDGAGIPADIQPKIFDPFFTTKPIGEGTGLGLDIVKKIVEKHNGAITVESRPGQTTFAVYIPLTGG